jgi:hypothetical protein
MRDHRAVAEATRAQVWDRWQEGLGLTEISRTLGVRAVRVSSRVSSRAAASGRPSDGVRIGY